MTPAAVAFFGDVVGRPGRAAFAHAARALRSAGAADAIVVNGENARHGVGLHPKGYGELRDAGADAVTTGDHYADDAATATLMSDPDEPVCKPINARRFPAAQRRLVVRAGGGTVAVLTVLGRLFMRDEPDEPFAALESAMERLATEVGPTAVIVEVHAEATSEKQALARFAASRWPGGAGGDGRGPWVAAVLGTHTHTQTSDARLIGGTAAMTDLGMCGGVCGVIGFGVEQSIRKLRGISPAGLDLAEGASAAEGALLTVDLAARVTRAIAPLRIAPPDA